MKNKKILVTGGAGFVGSSLCEQLVKDNQVWSVDNYFTGTYDNHIEGVEYIRDDAKNLVNLAIDGVIPTDLDIVYHLGEYSRVEQSYNDLKTVLDYNVYSIAPVVEFCKTFGAKLIYSASSTKFCEQAGGLSPYAWSKATNVDYIKNYDDWYGLNYAITYFYNVYGDREIATGTYATVIAKFIAMKQNGITELPVTSPGTQLRNFTHIDDIVSGLILVGEKGQGDGYGIGSPKPYSILDVVELLGCTPAMMPEKKGNRMGAAVVSSKTKELGWNPVGDLKKYLEGK